MEMKVPVGRTGLLSESWRGWRTLRLKLTEREGRNWDFFSYRF